MSARRIRVVSAMVGFLFVGVAAALPAAAAPGGYGPIGEDPATAIGLSADILVAGTVDESGGVVTAPTDYGIVAVRVPAGVFTIPVQVSIADLPAPAGGSILPSSVKGRYVAGFGVSARLVAGAAGSPAGPLPNGKSMTFSVSKDSRIRVGDIVYLVTDAGVSAGIKVTEAGVLGVELSGPTSVLVVRPGAAAASPSPSPTTTDLPHTGAQGNESGLALWAGAAIAFGIGLLVLTRRRGTARRRT